MKRDHLDLYAHTTRPAVERLELLRVVVAAVAQHQRGPGSLWQALTRGATALTPPAHHTRQHDALTLCVVARILLSLDRSRPIAATTDPDAGAILDKALALASFHP